MNSWPALPRPTQQKQVGGHEGVGSVVKFGTGEVPSFIKLGDRVGIKWVKWICGSCSACLDSHDGLCSSQKISGYLPAIRCRSGELPDSDTEGPP